MPSVIRQAWADGIRPDIVLAVSAWADTHRLLPKKSSAEPGPWRTDRTPYLREIMDCFSSTSEVEEVIFMKSAQVGGTEAILNALGCSIDHSPAPAILVQPTVELAKRFSRQRLEPLLTLTPRLLEKVARSRARDSGNTMLSKEYPGGQLIITGANSAVGLRSMPAQYAFLDEIDGYPVDVDGEGSPIELVEARQRTFARRKRMKVSTPTISGRSAIESAFEATDQRRFYVPCPDCGEMQPLEFPRLTWSKLGLRPDQAVYECRACMFSIAQHHKTQLLAKGEWRPEKPERVGKVRGYHINALYAPVGWISWGDIADKFAKNHKNPEKHRVFINTILGETWAERGEAPEWEPLYRRREDYAIGRVPAGALFLTAGVDIQKDRIIYEVVGWGRGRESWSVEYGFFQGDTNNLRDSAWAQLDALLARRFIHAHGAELAVRVLAIDTGYNTSNVYAWSSDYPTSRVVPVDGRSYGAILVGTPTPVVVKLDGRKLKRGARLFPVAVNLAKDELYGWLHIDEPITGPLPPGWCHFPKYDEEYFKQLTSEQLVTRRTAKGYLRREWEVLPGRQNHVLDIRVYARAAAALAGLDRLQASDWLQLERSLAIPERAPDPDAPPPAAKPAPASAKKPWLRPRQGGWLKGRR